MEAFLEKHGGELTILIVVIMVLATLLIALPQLLRVHRAAQEMLHAERMRGIEQGMEPPQPDYRSQAAGRTTFLVPMVVICVAGVVTCFLVGFRSESLFTVALIVWVVAGTVSLAAITGGVALMGRLAQLHSGVREDEPPPNPLEG